MRRFHDHPCGACGAPVPCDGAIERNEDGHPEVICVVYHLPDGEVAAVRCDKCLMGPATCGCGRPFRRSETVTDECPSCYDLRMGMER